MVNSLRSHKEDKLIDLSKVRATDKHTLVY